MSRKAVSSAKDWVKTPRVFRIQGKNGELFEIPRADFRQQLLSLKEFAKNNHWELPKDEMLRMKQILEVLFAFQNYPEIYTPLVRDVDRVFGGVDASKSPSESVAGYFISCVLKDRSKLKTTDNCNISSSIAIYHHGKILLHKINYSHIYIHVDNTFEYFDLDTLVTLDKAGIKEVTIIGESSLEVRRKIPIEQLNTQVMVPLETFDQPGPSGPNASGYWWLIALVLVLLIIGIILYRNRQRIALRRPLPSSAS